jgi:putative CocE/NonD family hydrolase
MGTVIRDVMVRMRDGIGLATDIYLPAQAALPAPVLVERTPYDRRGTNHGDASAENPTPLSKPEMARRLAAAGYVVVLQDCRGRYGSEGQFTKYVNEGPDGVDTLTWILQQSWCNGQIGSYGLSYGAHVQGAMAVLSPAGLRAMWIDSGAFSSAFHSGIRQGGAFELKQVTWAYRHALLSPLTLSDPKRRKALEKIDISQAIWQMDWAEGTSPLAAAPEYERYLLDQWRSGRFDKTWTRNGLYLRNGYKAISQFASVLISSWYDPYAATATENFIGITSFRKGAAQLILGPWTHGQRSVTYSGAVDFGPQSLFDHRFPPDYADIRRRWFDAQLKHSGANPLKAPVEYFVMGGGSGKRLKSGRIDHGGHWRSAISWPPPGTRAQKLCLTQKGLSPRPSRAKKASRLIVYDPHDPVPTLGGATASGGPVMEAGAFHQPKDRQDVLYFETAPFKQAVDVIGAVQLVLYVSSDCPDTDFTFKLIDVYPPSADFPEGFAMNLTHGILRARYRRGFDQEAFMQPGRRYKLVIDGFPTANRFGPGHRLRLDVSSSNFPHFDRNPNSGEAIGRAQHPRIAHNQVHLDARSPSHLIIPIMKKSRAKP